VTVLARPDDGDLCIEVRDTGPGIPLDKLPQVFQRYYQVGDEARRKGAGLGLSIALAVARAHGGDIEAESEPEHGTVFRVRLPISVRPADTQLSRPGPTEPAART
jgi:signal transduction histidine kinase